MDFDKYSLSNVYSQRIQINFQGLNYKWFLKDQVSKILKN